MFVVKPEKPDTISGFTVLCFYYPKSFHCATLVLSGYCAQNSTRKHRKNWLSEEEERLIISATSQYGNGK